MESVEQAMKERRVNDRAHEHEGEAREDRVDARKNLANRMVGNVRHAHPRNRRGSMDEGFAERSIVEIDIASHPDGERDDDDASREREVDREPPDKAADGEELVMVLLVHAPASLARAGAPWGVPKARS